MRARKVSDFAGMYRQYTEFRKGDRRPVVRLRSVLPRDQRATILTKVVSVMRNWSASPFEYEGTLIHNLRSGLCLRGMRWGQADFEARSLVAAALNSIGAQRPTWEEGQPEHTTAVENCGRCGQPLDDDQITRRARHCSVECAKATLAIRQTVHEREHTALGRSAVYFVYRHDQPTRPCKTCGAHFHPAAPSSDQVHCSVKCAKLEFRRGEERCCEICGDQFYAKADKIRDGFGKFCSRTCYAKSKTTARYAKNCAWCGADFIAGGAKAHHCSKVCTSAARLEREGITRSVLSPHVFDHYFSMPINASRPVWLTPERFDEMVAA